MTMVCTVEDFLTEGQRSPILDVRSPSEYQHGHIPSALSMPLFSDEERHEVGLLYHEHGRDAAVRLGLERAQPKLTSFVDYAREHSVDNTVRVYCWRGGMRSEAVAWLLSVAGMNVTVLRKGYKAWRRLALETLATPKPYVVLGGNTGAAKTAILACLKAIGESVIDLEFHARHRGSAFGWLGQTAQSSQEQFENDLAWDMLQHQRAERLWIEDESRRIGAVNIPTGMWDHFLAAPLVYLQLSRELRVNNLVNEYAQFSIPELRDAVQRISARLGPERTRAAYDALSDANFAAVAEICLQYYDLYYERGLKLRDATKIVPFDAGDLSREEVARALVHLCYHHDVMKTRPSESTAYGSP